MAQSANVSRTDASLIGLNLNTLPANSVTSTYVANDGRTLLVVKNSSGSPVTATLVTFQTQMSKDGFGSVALANQSVGIPSASTVLIGPFPPGRWSNAAGVVAVSLSTTAGVSTTSIRLPR